MKYFFLSAFVIISNIIIAQQSKTAWVKTQFAKLSQDEKIAQLMVLRLSETVEGGKVVFYDDNIRELIKKYNIGGICLFQGGATYQAGLINEFQRMAKTPLMVCIDGEWGVGMRLLDTVPALPRQMMLGATRNEKLVYDYGTLMAKQCKRMGIQVNYAPVVDVNNNPANPVINDRSFGEDKYNVAQLGVAIMKGMQDSGIIACAKHFPGHGDVAVDSHYDLPIINKSMKALDSLELYPFKAIFKAGVGSVMIAHLSIPAIDKTPNKPTSISYNNVTKLMRQQLGYKGLSFTDALNMKGLAKYYPDGVAAAESLIAGNDMLCLPSDVPNAIAAIKKSIKLKKLSWKQIDEKVMKVLEAKYQTGLHSIKPIELNNLAADLTQGIADITVKVAKEAITFLPKNNETPIALPAFKRKALICIGRNTANSFATKLQDALNADVFYFDYEQRKATADSIIKAINNNNYEYVITSVHAYHNRPANNFKMSDDAIALFKNIQQTKGVHINFNFGNPYALNILGKVESMYQCYEDKPIIQEVAADFLYGFGMPNGQLPVSLQQYSLQEGFTINKKKVTALVK
jgi:beta-N-acetylhexosaminidase